MKRNILTYLIYALYVVGTVITLFIVNRNIDNSFSFKFVIGYVIFLLSSFLYFIVVTIINLKKLKRFEIRIRFFKFVTLFILFSAVTYILNYIFRPSKIDIYDFGTPLGIALAFAFFDLMVSNKS